MTKSERDKLIRCNRTTITRLTFNKTYKNG